MSMHRRQFFLALLAHASVASFPAAAQIAPAERPQSTAAPQPSNAPRAQSGFVVVLVDPLDVRRGGPVRARALEAPAEVGLRTGLLLAGEATTIVLPAESDAQRSRRVTIRWNALVPQGGGRGTNLAPPGESVLRTAADTLPAGTQLRVAWAGRSAGANAAGAPGFAARAPNIPAGPNPEQEMLARRARDAARFAPAGSGQTITVDMLTGRVANPLAPAPLR